VAELLVSRPPSRRRRCSPWPTRSARFPAGQAATRGKHHLLGQFGVRTDAVLHRAIFTLTHHRGRCGGCYTAGAAGRSAAAGSQMAQRQHGNPQRRRPSRRGSGTYLYLPSAQVPAVRRQGAIVETVTEAEINKLSRYIAVGAPLWSRAEATTNSRNSLTHHRVDLPRDVSRLQPVLRFFSSARCTPGFLATTLRPTSTRSATPASAAAALVMPASTSKSEQEWFGRLSYYELKSSTRCGSVRRCRTDAGGLGRVLRAWPPPIRRPIRRPQRLHRRHPRRRPRPRPGTASEDHHGPRWHLHCGNRRRAGIYSSAGRSAAVRATGSGWPTPTAL